MNWHNAVSNVLQPLTTASRLGLMTDMDGTISPIVQRPEDAHPTAHSRELLAALAEKLALVAVISGRGAADLQARVGLPQLVYIGNHGLERWNDGRAVITPAAQPFRASLEAALDDFAPYQVEGMQIEDKGATISIHYRRTADPASVAHSLTPTVQQIAAKHGLAAFPGRMIFELRPPIPINKGTAFRQLVSEYQLDAAVYIGDDVTDADALSAARELRSAGACYAVGVGVLSGDTPTSVLEAADVLASGISDVEAFLTWLFHAASASRS